MTILTEAELQRRMGMTIDPNSIPRHDGGDLGYMEGVIQRGSDTRVVEQGKGRRGTEVYDAAELGDPRFYGSATVISVKDQPPLPEQMDPKKVEPPAPVKPRSPAELLAILGLSKRK